MSQQKGCFDEDFRLENIGKQGDSLRKLYGYIDWEMFRPILKKTFHKEVKGPEGRPPFDRVMMFKNLVLQRLYNRLRRLDEVSHFGPTSVYEIS